MPLLRKKPEASMTVQQERAEAEERSWALLRHLVSEKEWDGHTSHPIRVEAPSGWVYEISFGSTSENILRRKAGHLQRVCGGPYPHNDYLDPRASRRDGYPRLNDQAWSAARERARAEGHYVQPLTLPNPDIWLGQYLAIKYDEEFFLMKARVSGRNY